VLVQGPEVKIDRLRRLLRLAGVSWLAEATLASVLVSCGVEGGLVYDLSSGRTDEADARQASLVHAAATQEIGHELGET
jgi:hypothetical protein